MDPQLLQQLTTFLAPFLPYLLKAGEKAAEEAGKKLGEAAWEQAKAIWEKLRRKKNVEQVAQTAAALPDNAALLEALRTEIVRALQEDAVLRAEVARLWEQAKAAGVNVIASGERSVAIGGNVSGSVIITGDQNVVQHGKYNVSIGQVGGAIIGDQNPEPAKKTSKGITMIPVDSSMVDSVGYDEEHRLLQVIFTSGRVYCYEDVPPEVFQGLLEAESKGQYMRAYIIDVYPYRRGPCRKR